MTAAQLRSICEKLGLSQHGSKNRLIERIFSAVSREATFTPEEELFDESLLEEVFLLFLSRLYGIHVELTHLTDAVRTFTCLRAKELGITPDDLENLLNEYYPENQEEEESK